MPPPDSNHLPANPKLAILSGRHSQATVLCQCLLVLLIGICDALTLSSLYTERINSIRTALQMSVDMAVLAVDGLAWRPCEVMRHFAQVDARQGVRSDIEIERKDSQGRWQLFYSSSDDVRRWSEADRTSQSTPTFLRSPDGWGFYMWSEERRLQAGTFRFLVARQESWVNRSTINAVVALVCGFLLLLAASWIIVGYAPKLALRPLRSFIRQAKSIHPASLNGRLSKDGLSDELGELAQVLNSLFDRVEESINRERRFAEDLAHELRTPLMAQSTLGAMALIHRTGPDAQDPYDAVQGMLEESTHMERLVYGLRTLAHVTTLGGQISLQTIDANQVVVDCVETLQVLGDEKKQQISCVLRTASFIEADMTMLRQSLMNLLHNAIAHAQVGAEIIVRVEATAVSNRVQIIVEDNGPGIPLYQQGLVFQRFFRGSRERDPSFQGLGLGLAIAKAMTEAQGGRISLKSTPGAGTRVILSLKKAVTEQAADLRHAALQSTGPNEDIARSQTSPVRQIWAWTRRRVRR